MSTTTGKLTKELKRFSSELGKVVNELGSELEEMKKMRRALLKEMEDTAEGFVDHTLTGYEGGEFDTMATIAQTVEELGTQGLSYFRDNLLHKREAALNAVNETQDKTVDPDGFHDLLQQAEQTYEAAKDKFEDEAEKLDAAELALDSWRENTMEDDLVELDDKIAKAGGLRLVSDNRSYYEVPSIFVAVWRYVTDSTYRKVRHTLEDFGHLRDGKDAFADIASFREKFEGFKQAIVSAQELAHAASEEAEKAQTLKDKLSGFSADIITDKQVLAEIQDKVAKDLLKSPEFIEAMAGQYAEDFPRNLAFLVAKLSTLDKLREGTQAKYGAVKENYDEVYDQYKKMKGLRSGLKVRNIDLDDLRKQNDAYRSEVEHYTRAARHARERADGYNYNDFDYARQRSGSIGSANNGPSFIETMLMYQILTAGNRPSQHFERPTSQDLAKDSRYVTDLMGVDKDTADRAGLPKGVFDISPQTSKEMADLGVKNYKPGDLKLAFDVSSASSYARSKGLAFDIKSPPPPPRRSYSSSSIGGGMGGGGSSFKI